MSFDESQHHKYTLVEAEVVDEGNSANNNTQKKHFNNANQPRKPDQKKQDFLKNRRPQGNRRGNRRRDYQQYDHSMNGGYPDLYYPNMLYANDQKTSEYYTQFAVKQIENYFSTDNLCRDIFLRQYMDVEGYIPIAFICNFPLVACYCAPYESITEQLKQSSILEVDEANETVRLKSNWEMWLLPNQQGGYGVPRYIKIQEPQNQTQEIDGSTSVNADENYGSIHENNDQNLSKGGQYQDRRSKKRNYQQKQQRRYSRKKATECNGNTSNEKLNEETTTEEQTPVEVIQQQAPVEVIQQQVPVEVTQQQVPVEVTQQQVPVEVTQQQVPVEEVSTPTVAESKNENSTQQPPESKLETNGDQTSNQDQNKDGNEKNQNVEEEKSQQKSSSGGQSKSKNDNGKKKKNHRKNSSKRRN